MKRDERLLMKVVENTKPQQPTDYERRRSVYITSAYAWGTNIPIPTTEAWDIHTVYMAGVATATFMPEIRIMDANGYETLCLVGGQVDTGDVYQVSMATGIAQQSVAPPAGVPNQFVHVELPPNLRAEEGYIDFRAYVAGVPEASTPYLKMTYTRVRLEER